MSNQQDMFNLIREFSGQANILSVPRLFIKAMGSVDGGLLLSQMIYWSDRTNRKDGFFFKSYEEWEDELTLSKHKVSRYSKVMVDAGFLETKLLKANGAPTVHYKVSISDFQKWIVKFFNNGKLNSLTMESEEIEQSLTETTTETTTEKKDTPRKKRTAKVEPVQGKPESSLIANAIPLNVSILKVKDIQETDLGPALTVDDWKAQLELEQARKTPRKTVVEYVQNRIDGMMHDESVSGIRLAGDLFVAIGKACVYPENTQLWNGQMIKQVKLAVEILEKRVLITGKQITDKHIQGFLEYYKVCDWRGQKGEELKPSFITEKWESYAIWVRDGKKQPQASKQGYANGTQKQVAAWTKRNEARATVAKGESDDNWG